MKFDPAAVRKCLKSFDFKTLFREHLGWDNHQAQLNVPIGEDTVTLTAVAEKRGFVAYTCPAIPDRPTRLKVDHQITKSAREHFVIYTDQPSGQQVWHWVRREPGKPLASRDHRFDASQSGDPLIQRLDQIAVSLDEEETLTLPDVAGRIRSALDVDKVTKKFYDRFKAEHAAFTKFIKGIKAKADLQWYTSLMLNRLMFVYFIQKKKFLDGDGDYLRNRLARVRQAKGKDKFQTFYRYFLLRLFHDGLGKSPDERKLDAAMEKLLGKVPYLNGGFFEVHQLEEHNPDLDIPDKAFEKLFDFFDQYSWHLDERPLRADNEINPDVVGYIFEKYINQKQMGAYYTKEDITEYISKNTIIPFLFDAALPAATRAAQAGKKKCAVAFEPGSALWRLLRDDPDRYIYPAVRQGVVDENGNVIPLPEEIEAGVNDVARRDGWNRSATEPYALPTETWREHVARRQRCLEIREKLRKGEVHQINDLITLNLDIWQFARDAIVNVDLPAEGPACAAGVAAGRSAQAGGPDLLRAFWHAIEKVTVLDPTCGSGAFLFAALRILETLYSDCLARMERFVEDDDARLKDEGGRMKFTDFREILSQTAAHPNERYFILKSVIINNLFGVDIMEEAVEICKLRLFLKLVAQVEEVGQIEPLPDIDFNIRSGNTLVGYASLDQVRKSQEGTLGFGMDLIKRIEEDAELVERAFRQFRAQQTTHGGKVTREDKQELRARLGKLDEELDRYLAAEYRVSADNYRSKTAYEEAFANWKASHQPFHWFVEFFGIMNSGGFDVIIGNPPYVEYGKVVSDYTVRGYQSAPTKNLYGYVLERSLHLAGESGWTGMIVPVALVSIEGNEELRSLLLKRNPAYLSHFAIRPTKLFTGAEQRLTIYVGGGLCRKPSTVWSTRYNRWHSAERPFLFARLSYAQTRGTLIPGSLPKLGHDIEQCIFEKLKRQRTPLCEYYVPTGGSPVYYARKLRYFCQILDFQPRVLDGRGNLRPPSEFKPVHLRDATDAALALSCLNSDLFFWLVSAFSDCRHVNKREVDAFPLNLEALRQAEQCDSLVRLAHELMADIQSKSENHVMVFSHDTLTVQHIYPVRSKPIIDEIDRALAAHYGFTDEELDFIINYDIKYRMGGADGEDGEE